MKSLKGLDKYEVIEERHIGDLNSDGYLLKHRKTGAYITLLLNDDEMHELTLKKMNNSGTGGEGVLYRLPYTA